MMDSGLHASDERQPFAVSAFDRNRRFYVKGRLLFADFWPGLMVA
jgi:hypothetical protein